MNTTNTTDTTTEAVSTQKRVQHSYKALLTDGDGNVVDSDIVNLSYELDDGANAVTRDRSIVQAGSLAARLEAMDRLQRLAARGQRTHITPEQIEAAHNVDFELVRTTAVNVPLDADGRPIPRHAQNKG